MLPQLLNLFNNTLESFDKLSEAITTNSETVTLELTDSTGTVRRVTIPSFAYLKSEIERLNNNVNNISSLGTSQTSMVLPDGSIKKIMLSEIKAEASDITNLQNIENFNIKSNYFLESFINPYMYVSYDVTGQVSIDTERVKVQRYILSLDTQNKINWFINTYKGKSDIVYNTFLRSLIDNNVSYTLDEDVIDIPPRELRYNGKFDVLRITDTEITEEINNVEVTKKRKSYKLNKLTYDDIRSNFTDTVGLKIGDYLVVNSDPKDTRYKIISIDNSTNSVILELVEGYRGASIGTDIFSFYSSKDNAVEIQVGIGFNEYCTVFMKPIDPDSNVPANNWSPGSAFFTSDLKINLSDGTTDTLESYYKNEVTDFGTYILAMAKDRIPASILGIKPDAPILDTTAFKVVQINEHLTVNKSIDELKNLQSKKDGLISSLKQLDVSINNRRESIATKIYKNDIEKQGDKKEESNLITERNNKSEEYSSIVKQIQTKMEDESLSEYTPKYRIRGFFPFPTPKYSNYTGEQQLIRFKVAYRYLSKDGSANKVSRYQFADGSVTKNAAFTEWIEILSPVRKRTYDSDLGRYVWQEEEVENADQININSIDIPISAGESVEIRIKSYSEAGYPANPTESDWSESVTIDFPSEYQTMNPVANILENNSADYVKVKLQDELNSIGLYNHLSDSFTKNERYYSHQSTTIASGFLSNEQTPISLFDKLVDINNRIQEFDAILKKAKGTIVIKFIDENGVETLIKKNQLNKFFAGYYADQVSTLDVKKGVIINKTYFLRIENGKATTLELISKIPGSNNRMVRCSEDILSTTKIIPAVYEFLDNNDPLKTGNPSFSSSDSMYNSTLKYDLVPIILSNPTVIDTQISPRNPYQAVQAKSQFVYARYKDVAAEDSFYSHLQPDNSTDQITNADQAEYSYDRSLSTTDLSPTKFVWGGDFDTNGVPYRDDTIQLNFELHIDHPYISSKTVFDTVFIEKTGIPSSAPLADTKQIIRHSKFMPIVSDSPDGNGKKQCIYVYDGSADATKLQQMQTVGGQASTLLYERTIKCAFEEYDQYLLGTHTCGSYLFMSTDTHESICVDGKGIYSTKEIEFGSDSSVTVPITFQYRMTDYWGQGSSGLGNIGGDSTGATINLTYSKRMGIDVYDIEGNIFMFDIEVSAKYKSDNLNLEKIPNRQIQVAIDDLRRTMSNVSPTIIETKVDSK